MKWVLKILFMLIVVIVLYYAYKSYQEVKYLRSIEGQYPALKTDYLKSLIPARQNTWMIWDVKEKDTTINGGSVFDGDTESSMNLKELCNPKEVSYKNGIKVYDCGDFYGIFTLGYPPNPTLYGPFAK